MQKPEEKGLFLQISSDLLKPPSLKPSFAALQLSDFEFSGFGVLLGCQQIHTASLFLQQKTHYRYGSIVGPPPCMPLKQLLQEDKRATTNMQNGLVFSFIPF